MSSSRWSEYPSISDADVSVTQKNSQVLILDAGHIAVDSKLADQEQLNEVQAKRGRQYSDDDYKQLEELMYDRVLLKLDSTQVSFNYPTL